MAATLMQKLVAGSLPLVPRMLLQRVASRYIAGERIEDALAVVRRLNSDGAMATVDVLGEAVTEARDAHQATREYLRLVEALDVLGGSSSGESHSTVSVKLTQLGLELDRGLCHDNLWQIAVRAKKHGLLVRLDMEDHRHTDVTLQLYRELQPRLGNLGVVLQAMLRRTLDDVEMLPRGASVRLCKGIYLEPPRLAYQTAHEVRWSYLRCLDQLLERGCHVGLATHDERLLEAGLQRVRIRGLTATQYEVQMLLGVLPGLRARLIARGHRLRVYVPYGAQWYAYSLRRLRENPTLTGHIIGAALQRMRPGVRQP